MSPRQNYKGIGYQLSDANVWFVLSPLPGAALRWGFWSRFFTPFERAYLAEGRDDYRSREMMRTAIDRAINDSPVYRGDIRDQGRAT